MAFQVNTNRKQKTDLALVLVVILPPGVANTANAKVPLLNSIARFCRRKQAQKKGLGHNTLNLYNYSTAYTILYT